MTAMRWLAYSVASLALIGCRSEAPANSGTAIAASAPAPVAAPDPFAPREFERDGSPLSYSVVPYGYNYTDTYIDSFEVNGAGGGNLAVSTPTSPGGGHTCCASLYSGMPKGTKFTIKWTRSIYSKRWCEQTVTLNDPVPPGARYLEVHFYQDGRIEVYPSQQASPPKLELERHDSGKRHETGNVNNDEKHSTCHDGYYR